MIAEEFLWDCEVVDGKHSEQGNNEGTQANEQGEWNIIEASFL